MSADLRRIMGLAALSLAGCGPGSSLPIQPTPEVVAVLGQALRACAAGLTPEGSIDQRAIAAAGWRAVHRSTRLDAENRQLPADAYPTLRPGEYEATEWERSGSPNRLYLIRQDVGLAALHDSCGTDARTANRGEVDQVAAAVARFFRRPPDRAGVLPRGGDFLTPRFDPERYGRYWAMPRNDVYLTSGDDGHVSFSVVAMPNRAALDRHSPDNPAVRIPTPEGNP